MGITVLPTGWEGIGEGLAGLGKGIGDGLTKKAELAAKAKEKDPFEKLQEWVAAKGMLENGGTSDDIVNVLGSDVLGLKAKEQMKAGGFLTSSQQPQLTPQVIDPIATAGIKTDPAIDALRSKEATIGIDLDKDRQSKILDIVNGQTEKTALSLQQVNRVANAMTGMVATAKQAMNEQGGAGVVPSAVGSLKRAYANLGIDKDLSASEQMSGLPKFRGQAREVTLSLSPILTGSTRIMASVLDMLSQTIPQDLNQSEATIVGQLKQTFKNSYRLSLGLAQAGLTEQDIAELEANSSTKAINDLVSNVMEKATMSKEDDEMFEKIWKEIKSTPASTAETFGEDEYSSYLKAIGEK